MLSLDGLVLTRKTVRAALAAAGTAILCGEGVYILAVINEPVVRAVVPETWVFNAVGIFLLVLGVGVLGFGMTHAYAQPRRWRGWDLKDLDLTRQIVAEAELLTIVAVRAGVRGDWRLRLMEKQQDGLDIRILAPSRLRVAAGFLGHMLFGLTGPKVVLEYQWPQQASPWVCTLVVNWFGGASFETPDAEPVRPTALELEYRLTGLRSREPIP